MFRFFTTTALVFALCGAALGQDEASSPTPEELKHELEELRGQLEEIVVTSSRRAPAARGETATPLLDALRSVEVYGSVTGSYTWNLANPAQRRGANDLRLSDADHNTFTVPFATLGLARRISGLNELDAGFGLELAAGSMVPDAFRDDGMFDSGALNLPQAYVDLQIPTPLTALRMRIGRSYLPFGVESVDPSANPHFSLSYSKHFMPRTATGVSLGMDLGAGLSYTQWVVNGWDRVIDNNDAKTFAGQLAWRVAGADALFTLNWIAGAERDDNTSDKRWAIELGMQWKPRTDLDLRASFLYGQETFSPSYPNPGQTARFGGFTLMGKKSYFLVEGEDYHHLAFALRGSYFRDQGGSRTGLDQALGEVTATVEFRPIRDAALRVEYRRDFSSRSDAFQGHRGGPTRDGQDTFSLSLSYAF
ncbi:MAG: porin [Planctomycetes bacterium]|nr:porin [Planctomycetota bacterium]